MAYTKNINGVNIIFNPAVMTNTGPSGQPIEFTSLAQANNPLGVTIGLASAMITGICDTPITQFDITIVGLSANGHITRGYDANGNKVAEVITKPTTYDVGFGGGNANVTLSSPTIPMTRVELIPPVGDYVGYRAVSVSTSIPLNTSTGQVTLKITKPTGSLSITTQITLIDNATSTVVGSVSPQSKLIAVFQLQPGSYRIAPHQPQGTAINTLNGYYLTDATYHGQPFTVAAGDQIVLDYQITSVPNVPPGPNPPPNPPVTGSPPPQPPTNLQNIVTMDVTVIDESYRKGTLAAIPSHAVTFTNVSPTIDVNITIAALAGITIAPSAFALAHKTSKTVTVSFNSAQIDALPEGLNTVYAAINISSNASTGPVLPPVPPPIPPPTFPPPPLPNIYVNALPAHSGILSGGGSYTLGNTVVVDAVTSDPSTWAFVSWTENGLVVSTSPRYQFVASGDRDLVANFNFIFQAPITPNQPPPPVYFPPDTPPPPPPISIPTGSGGSTGGGSGAGGTGGGGTGGTTGIFFPPGGGGSGHGGLGSGQGGLFG